MNAVLLRTDVWLRAPICVVLSTCIQRRRLQWWRASWVLWSQTALSCACVVLTAPTLTSHQSSTDTEAVSLPNITLFYFNNTMLLCTNTDATRRFKPVNMHWLMQHHIFTSLQLPTSTSHNTLQQAYDPCSMLQLSSDSDRQGLPSRLIHYRSNVIIFSANEKQPALSTVSEWVDS